MPIVHEQRLAKMLATYEPQLAAALERRDRALAQFEEAGRRYRDPADALFSKTRAYHAAIVRLVKAQRRITKIEVGVRAELILAAQREVKRGQEG